MKENSYWQPTPKKWRMTGDMALVLIPIIQGAIIGAPNLDSVQKYWGGFIVTLLLTAVKFWTNTKKETPTE